MIKKCIILSIIISITISCGDNLGSVEQNKETKFYLIRHAEKDRSNPENKNPDLTKKGMERANYWASYFDSIPLNSIYTTDFRRTKETIAPISKLKDINPRIYSPNKLDFNQFIKSNNGKSVLISGHSNTTPYMVNKIIGEKRFSDMLDSDNKSLFIIKIVNSKSTVEVRSVDLE